MAVRSTRGDNASRTYGYLARATVEKIKDKPKRQELDLNLLHEETKTDVERFQNYGFSSVPLKPSSKGKKKEYAGAVVVFPSGDRSHGVVLAVDDKRHRPTDLKDGESTLYDDQGQRFHLTREGIDLLGGDKRLRFKVKIGDHSHTFKKDEGLIEVGNASVSVKDGKIILKVGDMKAIITASRIDLGGEGGSPVSTVAGPSTKVFAIL